MVLHQHWWSRDLSDMATVSGMASADDSGDMSICGDGEEGTYVSSAADDAVEENASLTCNRTGDCYKSMQGHMTFYSAIGGKEEG